MNNNLSIRAKRVLEYLRYDGPDMADSLPTNVAAKYVAYVTNRVEQAYDNAVTELLTRGLAENFDGPNGYTYIRAI